MFYSVEFFIFNISIQYNVYHHLLSLNLKIQFSPPHSIQYIRVYRYSTIKVRDRGTFDTGSIAAATFGFHVNIVIGLSLICISLCHRGALFIMLFGVYCILQYIVHATIYYIDNAQLSSSPRTDRIIYNINFIL